jgi:hypothetical protein
MMLRQLVQFGGCVRKYAVGQQQIPESNLLGTAIRKEVHESRHQRLLLSDNTRG